MSGSGKSTFAARHFLPTEVLSSDFCRGLVADDENDQSATNAAFDVLHFIAGKRLDGRPADRRRRHQRPARGPARAGRPGQGAPRAGRGGRPRRARSGLRRAQRRAPGPPVRAARAAQPADPSCAARCGACAGRASTASTSSPARTRSTRRPSSASRCGTTGESDHGPFDIIGDVHGCYRELTELLADLGYEVDADGTAARHPEGRRALFLGDLVDRGPATPAVLRLVMGMVAEGNALCIPGNHEVKLLRALQRPRT